MPESKPKPSAPPKSGLEIKPVKDLEPDDSQSEDVRGGQVGAGPKVTGIGWLPAKVSDAALKSQVAPLGDALVKLRELRSSSARSSTSENTP